GGWRRSGGAGRTAAIRVLVGAQPRKLLLERVLPRTTASPVLLHNGEARRCARICPMTAGSWLVRSTLSTSEYDILRYISLSAPGTSSLAAHNVGGRGAGGRLRCLRSYAHRNQRQQGG